MALSPPAAVNRRFGFQIKPEITPPPIPTNAGTAPTLATAVGLLAIAVGSAAAQEYKAGQIRIDAPWMRATPTGAQVAGGYMKIRVFVESCGWIVGINASESRIVTGFRAGVGALGAGRDFDGGCGEAEASAVGCVCVPRLPA
jgi:hypothetical protein